MLLSTDFASENDLLDRIMDRGIVVEVWDQIFFQGRKGHEKQNLTTDEHGSK
jgi:hypothetical protein